MMTLKGLGFDAWFEERAAEYGQSGCSFARVTAVNRGSYIIRNETGEATAELTGRLFYLTDDPADLPCVGDWVTAAYYNDGSGAIIHKVFPRRTFLRRKSAGDNVTLQMIAANIDTAFIMQSCHFDFNPRRLDRYLVMAADGHVEPVVILSKIDLISADDLAEKIALVQVATRARVLPMSNQTGAGLVDLVQLLLPGKTCCLIGSSGVGKTTLLNRLTEGAGHATRAVSATGEGVHTTTRRELILLGGGAMLIDTPGMRELGLVAGDDGFDLGFAELGALGDQCRYTDCSHQHEPGCAVRGALERGELSAERYASYLKLKKEATFNELSYQDRRKKEKAFGKFVKTGKKQLRK